MSTSAASAGPPTRAVRPAGWLVRVRAAGSAGFAGLLGLLPHVLHHAGPLAGAALFAGLGGSLLFGALGLAAAVPFLVRMRHRCVSWRQPLSALTLMAAAFSLSTFVIGPALTGGGDEPSTGSPPAAKTRPAPPEHDAHH